MSNFKIGDSIAQLRYDKVIRKGEVVKGPFKVDGVDHYHVKWNWEDNSHSAPIWAKQDLHLIADLRSTKFSFELA